MRRLRKLIVRSFVLGAALVVSLPVVPAGASAGPEQSTLEVIRAASHDGFDRVVFEFAGPVPPSEVRYVRRLVGDPSGQVVPLPGQATLQVTMRDTVAHDELGDRASRRNTFPLPNVMSVLRAGDFEGVVTYGIGLAERQNFTTFTLTDPSRLVVDIQTVPTVLEQVFFIDTHLVEEGVTPFVTQVSRPVLPLTPATGVMDRLFAGPTGQEAEEGLLPPKFPSLTERSGATGYKNLRINEKGIARVKLTGGCESGGSTYTVADEIMPSLRQFPNVDFVKIYDPSGNTAQPRGRSDSIPECLEP